MSMLEAQPSEPVQSGSLPSYEYKTIRITERDKHEFSGRNKRRRGGNVDRSWTVQEMGFGTAFTIEDEDGDDYGDFRARAEPKVVEHLNQMGAEGWRLVQFVPDPGYVFWPFGIYIFCRPVMPHFVRLTTDR